MWHIGNSDLKNPHILKELQLHSSKGQNLGAEVTV